MRLIDADALRQRMYHEVFETDTDMQKWDSGCWIRYKLFENCIESAPTISPDEVRGVGKWDRVETEFGLRCPKCGKLLDEYVNGGEWVALSEIPNYCPNCGAKMEVSDDA